MKRKLSALALSGVFCLYLGGMLTASLLLPDKDFLENENRVPMRRPPFSLTALLRGTYTKELETYVTDQFPLRDLAMALHAASERALGKTQIGDVYFGTDGALYQQAPVVDEARLTKNIEAVSAFAQAVDIPVTLSLLPTAAAIYQARLPQGARSADQQAVIDRVQAELQGISYTNCNEILENNKEDYIFYKTDHHWTSLGAYYGYQALLEGWGMTPRTLESLGAREAVSGDFYGTLARTVGAPWVPRDTIERIARPNVTVQYSDGDALREGTLYAPDMLKTTDQYRYFLGGSHALVKITGENPAGERLLVLRDSYSDALAPYLAMDFAEVHLLDLRYMKLSISAYARENGIDRVLVLYAAPNFAADGNLGFLR